ncbi:MAG: hypothetical protein ACTTIC_06635 [Helicobacteraceae bacterium]
MPKILRKVSKDPAGKEAGLDKTSTKIKARSKQEIQSRSKQEPRKSAKQT